ncbi:hypothetical protein D3C73_757120 [compost metagenome]
MEGEADPARLGGLVTGMERLDDLLRPLAVKSKQIMAIGSGTGAAASGLNAKAVIKQSDRQIIVDILQCKGYDAMTFCMRPGQDGAAGNTGESGHELPAQLLLAPLHPVFPAVHLFLQLQAQRDADRLEKARCAAVLADLHIIYVTASAPGIDPDDGAAAGFIRKPAAA